MKTAVEDLALEPAADNRSRPGIQPLGRRGGSGPLRRSNAPLDRFDAQEQEITFHAGSADELPFEDGPSDAVVGNFAIHHSGHPDKVLEEAHRVLWGSGMMAFTVPVCVTPP